MAGPGAEAVDVDYRFGAEKTIICTAEGGPPTPPPVSIQTGLFEIFGSNGQLLNLEAAQDLGPVFANLSAQSGSTLLAVQGAQAGVILDLANNATVFGDVGMLTDPPQQGRFGYVGASQPSPGPATPAALLNYASPGGPFPFGGFLLNYDNSSQTFPSFGQLLPGAITDAFPAGGTVVSNEILGCADGGPLVIQYSPGDQRYDLIDTDFDVGRGCVSMITAAANGPVLSVSRTQGNFTDSRLYFTDRSGTATEIGSLGVDARRIRQYGE